MQLIIKDISIKSSLAGYNNIVNIIFYDNTPLLNLITWGHNAWIFPGEKQNCLPL